MQGVRIIGYTESILLRRSKTIVFSCFLEAQFSKTIGILAFYKYSIQKPLVFLIFQMEILKKQRNYAGAGWSYAGAGWSCAGAGWSYAGAGWSYAGAGWSYAGAGWSYAAQK